MITQEEQINQSRVILRAKPEGSFDPKGRWHRNSREDKALDPDFLSLLPEELTEYMKEAGYPAFRGKQVFEWLHKKQVMDPAEMTNLPKELKERLTAGLHPLEELRRQTSSRDGTVKFLFSLYDGQAIETVFMPSNYGHSLCISSQAGCRMGCSFCASTIGGLVRNLTPGEMLSQVYEAVRRTGKRVDSIVVMGTGEPLDNYENLIRFLKLISAPEGYQLSLRSITVSSCGLVPKIRELAEEGLPITFALSLHASTDEERQKLMPIAKRYTIRETLDACKYYFDRTHRRVTFEYSLVGGVNDSKAHAERLSRLLKPMNGHVNLIPINPIRERDYQRGNDESVHVFKNILEKNGINVTIRRSMGSDIDAACGQLRLTALKNSPKPE
ncbi:MAG: 23S rRNA (adenine(2503)-C(2))-methyltransferase RlmN [Eubacterium sp.]|nr:23S rRNA (adenine(2503)-C(2))-methyltransferase RlmN [Eubacterium sp.]